MDFQINLSRFLKFEQKRDEDKRLKDSIQVFFS